MQGVHPRLLTDGFEIAKTECLRFLDTFAVLFCCLSFDPRSLSKTSRTTTSFSTAWPAPPCAPSSKKPYLSHHSLHNVQLADHLTEMVTDAVLTVKRPGKPLDILMIEQMEMITKDALDSRLVKGLVLDHGARHPDMPKSLKNCYVLILNVSLEYEKSETNASFVYSTAQERDELVAAERKFTDDKVRKIIDFKNTLCPPDGDRSFVVINQKGIDPLSLDMLAKASFSLFFWSSA